MEKETGKKKTANAFVIFENAHKEESGSDYSNGSELCFATACKDHTQSPTMYPFVTWVMWFIPIFVPSNKKAQFNKFTFPIKDKKEARINKNWILLDSEATCNVIANTKLVKDMHTVLNLYTGTVVPGI